MIDPRTTRLPARVQEMARHGLIQGIRRMAVWVGAKPPPGGWRDLRASTPAQMRPVKRSHIAARQRERRETRRALMRLVLFLPAGLFALFFIVQLQTPEQMALQRLKSAALTSSISPVALAATKPQSPDYAELSFSELASFDFTVTPDIYDGRANPEEASARATEQIPESIKRRDGEAVTLQGFMLPLKLKKGKAVEWLLCRDQSDCCFGKTPRMNHWVLVRSASGVKPAMGQPVTCSGTLRVGEMRDEGFLTGIHQMDAVKACLKE